MLVILLFFTSISISIGLDRRDLYPYGPEVGDTELGAGEDTKEEVTLPYDFVFYRRSFQRAYVDTNGIITFNRGFRDSNDVQILPTDSPPMICPFWCDANTRYSGAVYFRVVTEDDDSDGLLMRARQEIMAYFIDNQMFEPKCILIATWVDVGYIWNSTLTNTFQAVLMSDGEDSFSSFLYPSNGINWPPVDQLPNAIAGFNFGNGIRSIIIPHTEFTHEILDIEESSNVHSTGKWLFRVNLYRIDSPPYNSISRARIVSWPEDITVEYGDLISFSCTARGWPIPFVTFEKEEESLMDDLRFTFHIIPEDAFTISALVNLTFAEVNDTGDYICLAIALESEEAGQDEESFFIGVISPPEIIFITENDTFISGTDRYLRCVAQGYPLPKIYWTTNALSFNTGYEDSNYSLASYTTNTPDGYILLISVLELHPVLPDDHGTYTCVATNSVGEQSSSVEITVLSPPEILTKPMNTTLYRGDDHVFMCESKGRPPPIITWTKDGTVLRNSTNIMISETVNGSVVLSKMFLSNATLEDIGVYGCSAENNQGKISEMFDLLVNAAVEIIFASPETYVINNNSVVLNCTAYGNPLAKEIVWTADNSLYTATELSIMANEVLQDEFTVFSSLFLPFVTLESRGKYTCTTHNEINGVKMFDEEIIPLLVLAAPAIVASDSQWNVTEGTNITLSCTAVGYPLPSIYWMKQDENSQIDTVFTIFVDDITVTAEVSIHTSIDDGGKYICHANNTQGAVSTEVDVIVRAPPIITYITPITMVAQYENLTVELECVATGYPVPNIMWEFEDEVYYSRTTKDIEDGRVSVILIENITLSQRGNYTCFATNSEGTQKATVELVVNAPPDVTIEEVEIMVIKGNTVTLVCQVIGFPESDIYWMARESLLLGNQSRIMRNSAVEFTSYLTLENVTLDNNGNYSCYANNSFGTDSDTVEVIVSAQPLVMLEKPDDTIFQGNDIVLRCEAVGLPLPSVTWASNSPANLSMEFFIQYSVEYNDRQNFLVVSELTLRNAMLSLRGRYTCIANNSLGIGEDHTTLMINAPPVIATLSSDTTEVIVNETVTFQCTSFGYPLPSIRWLHNTETLDPSDADIDVEIIDDITVRSMLVISNIQYRERGTYTCEVVNTVGSASRDVEISVIEPPWITFITPPILASVNDNVQLECVVFGIPRPTVVWVHDGSYLGSENVYSDNEVQNILTLINIQVDDMGLYFCTASNAGGDDTAVTSITVKVAPTIDMSVNEINVTAGETITLECRADGNPPPTIYWTYQGMNITNSERYSIAFDVGLSILKIFMSTLDDFGVYTCTAVNEEGQSSHNITVIVLSPPTLHIIKSSCVATGFPRPEISWFDGVTGEAVSNSSRFAIAEVLQGTFSIQSSLIVTAVSSDTSGRLYYCHAVNKQGSISLVDNTTCSDDQIGPSIIVAFEELSFLVQESNTALLVCLTTATVTRPFHVEVHPMEGTATVDEDFDGHIVSVGFEVGSSTRCTHIPIFDDEAVEGGEYFTISLFTPYENVEIPLNIADVTIFPDNDGTTVQFALPVYSVLEGETITVCIVAEEDIERLVYVNIVAYPAGELDLNSLVRVTGRRECFLVTALLDGEDERREFVELWLTTDDKDIRTGKPTTIIVSDYNGNRDDAILKYHYGYPKVQPLCVIAYFQARDGLERLKCQLWVGGNYTEKNCSEGYVSFYFEDYGDKRPYRLHIEGHSGEQETYTLSTTFHLATITSCWVHLINDGITVQGNSIVVEWSGTGALNYLSDHFKYLCRVDSQDPQPCSSPQTFADLSYGDHIIQIRHVENDLCLETPWQTYEVQLNF